MANQQVNLLTGKINWNDPAVNTDGSAITQGEITGYQAALRSMTIAGSAIGTYPILGAPVAPTAVNEALSQVTQSLKQDTYAAVVRAITATGNSAWSNEWIFDGVFPTPNPPVVASVA